MSDTAEPVVHVHVTDRVATITLNRPARRNALDLELAQALLQQVRAVAADPHAAAVVITGAGRGFCAGGDLVSIRSAIERDDWDSARQLLEIGRDVVLALHLMPKPVVAAVNGAAIGAGAGLALACDVRIASDDAVFAVPFVRLGLHPDWGTTYFLPRIAGIGRATELVFSGRTVEAVEAERLGIVSRVVPATALLQAAIGTASDLAQLSGEALALGKRSLGQSLHSTLEDLLDIEVQRQLRCFGTPSTKQALAAAVSRLGKAAQSS